MLTVPRRPPEGSARKAGRNGPCPSQPTRQPSLQPRPRSPGRARVCRHLHVGITSATWAQHHRRRSLGPWACREASWCRARCEGWVHWGDHSVGTAGTGRLLWSGLPGSSCSNLPGPRPLPMPVPHHSPTSLVSSSLRKPFLKFRWQGCLSWPLSAVPDVHSHLGASRAWCQTGIGYHPGQEAGRQGNRRDTRNSASTPTGITDSTTVGRLRNLTTEFPGPQCPRQQPGRARERDVDVAARWSPDVDPRLPTKPPKPRLNPPKPRLSVFSCKTG